MKFSLAAVGLALITGASALPSFAGMDPEAVREMVARASELASTKRQLPQVILGKKKLPDADHPFRAPSGNDVRGPCPGLNLMANHGYISRSGITNFNELVYGQQEAMGFGADLAVFLAALGMTVNGNPIADKLSIGGPDARVPNLGLLGSGPAPGGILKHNAYEIDASLTRTDVGLGDNRPLNGTLYEQMFKIADQMNGGIIDGSVTGPIRAARYEDSAARNPKFTAAPISTLFFGADQFLWRTMVTADEKTGKPVPCTRESLAAFYGAKDEGNGKWSYVPERFHDDWYRPDLPIGLTIPDLVASAVPAILYAAERGHLPVGITPQSLTSPDAFVCTIKQVVVGQLPTVLVGTDLLQSLLTNLGSVGANC